MIFFAPLSWFLGIIAIFVFFFLLIAFPLPVLIIVGLIAWALFAGMKGGRDDY